MSESFRSFRHLTGWVDERVREYTQLQDAIKQVSGLLDSIPEKKRLAEELDAKAETIRKSIATTEEAHKVMVEQFRKQRAELQATIQKEQQERVTARDAYMKEQESWKKSISEARGTLAELERNIQQRKGEIETLESELQSTVKAVLRR